MFFRDGVFISKFFGGKKIRGVKKKETRKKRRRGEGQGYGTEISLVKVSTVTRISSVYKIYTCIYMKKREKEKTWLGRGCYISGYVQ